MIVINFNDPSSKIVIQEDGTTFFNVDLYHTDEMYRELVDQLIIPLEPILEFIGNGFCG